MELFRILNVEEFKRDHQLHDSTLVDYCTGYDTCIYLLFSKSPPERIRGMFCNTIANVEYTAVRVTVDWNSGETIATEIFTLGRHVFNYHYVRPLKGDLLLLGARCHYKGEDDIEKNALIVDTEGNRKNEFCLGDGIQECITTEEGRIITGYSDEGIFGNYGWEYPFVIGSCGWIVWNAKGNAILRNKKYNISDCYAINIDERGNFWFYYYDEFKLVQTNFISDTVYNPEVSGASTFAVSESQQELLISGGYHDDQYYRCGIHREGGKLGEKESVTLMLCDKVIEKPRCHFRGSKLLFVVGGNILCGHYFK